MKASNEPALQLDIDFELCPICDGSLGAWATVSGYRSEQCKSCGFTLVNPRPTAEELSKYYATVGHGNQSVGSLKEALERERRYPNSTVDARWIVSGIAGRAPGRRFLDVGCGYGFFSREAQNRGFQVDAIEVASLERQCARTIANIVPEPVMFEQYDAEEGSYDAILMSQILEHVSDIRLWMAKGRDLLVPGGVLAVAVPNFASFTRFALGPADPLVHPPDHLNYFTASTLAVLLATAGFRVQESLSISRIPGSALTRRLRALPRLAELPLEKFMQGIQRPILWPIDRLGFGMFLNVLATKENGR